MIRTTQSSVVLFFALVLIGCSPTAIDPDQTLQVTGAVTMAGKPCDEAEISFQGLDVETNGRAKTTANGEFSIEGLMPGEYRVTIFRMSSDGQGIEPAFEKYAGKESELKAVVSAEEKQFNFQLGD